MYLFLHLALQPGLQHSGFNTTFIKLWLATIQRKTSSGQQHTSSLMTAKLISIPQNT
ncbi:uncharacterized protein RCO7_14668 [Rhynchosporium graminicola]|uniref:Uncharacterized protein n=1 Tax=Rhynchosporium graminicola TaxID=2792576 RepID=A0A1E1KUR1_9HELO|nr:uncharacterized protein RCO7_14668 [Rhynchosporium commune]